MKTLIAVSLSAAVIAFSICWKLTEPSGDLVPQFVQRKQTQAPTQTPTRAVAPLTRVSKPISVSVTSPRDERLDRLTNLAKIVVPTPEKIAALRDLLKDPKLKAEIHQSLNDPSSYSGESFHHKLRLLDAMYEGLKFPDWEIRSEYFSLAADILAEPPPSDYAGDDELQRQFVADRAEIALALLKSFPNRAALIEDVVKNRNPNAAGAFDQARRLKNTYEVAL